MQFPRWIDRDSAVNLREVAPNLYVGALDAVKGHQWAAVIDLYGSSAGNHPRHYAHVPLVLRWQFLDGDVFPVGLLEAIEVIMRSQLTEGPVLLHCQAGLSRSASAAYAMIRLLWGLSHDDARQRVHVRSDFPRTTTLKSARQWLRARKLID